MYIKKVFIIMLLVGQGLWGQQYGVKNIKSNDTLSIRSGPGAHTKKVGELPYNATEITRGYCTKSQSKKGPKKWCEVQVYAGELFVGWVAEKYLHEFSNAKQEAKYKNKKYKVIRHSPEEVLNVRAGMGSKFKIVEELAYNSKGIDILSCQKSNKKYKWCWINYGAQQGRNQFGWVFSKYLQLEKYGINNDQSIASNEEKIQKGIYEVTLEGLNIRDEPTGTRGKYVPGRVKGKAKKGMKVYADYFHGKWAITQYGTISRKYLKPSQIKFDKTMVLIDKNNTIDNLNILIKGDGEQCKVTMDKKGNNVSTNCLQPNDYTYCTNKRTICKSIYEIQYVFFRDEFPNIPERIVIRDYNEGSNLIKLNPKIEGIYEITVNGLEIDYEGKKITSKKGMKVYISPYSYSKSSQVVYTNYGRINRKYLKRSPIESDNIMVLLNANNRIDDLSILIKGNDEECKVTMDRRGKEISTNCVKPNFGTFCTERRTVCKGIHEIQYTFLEDVFPVDHIYILVNEFNRVNHFIEYKTKFKSSIGNLPLTDFCFYGLEYINTAFMSIQTSLSSEKINELKILLKETEELSKKCFDKDIYRDTWITGCFLGTDNIKKNIKKHMQEPYRIIPLNCSRIYRGFPVVAELIFYDRKENILTYKNVSHDMYYSSGYIPHEKVYDEKVQKKLATCQQKYIYMLTDVELGGIDDVSCEEISSKVIKNAQLNTSQKITKYMQQLHKECEQNNMDSCYKIIEYSDLDRAKELLSIEKKKVSKDNIRIAKIYNHMARLSRKNADTIGFLKKALALRKNALGEKHKDTAESYHDIGMYYIAIEDYPEGLTYLKKALQTREEVLGGEHEDTVESYYSLGNSYRKIGDYDKALKLLQKTLIIHENILGKETLAITYAYNSIGKVYNLMGNHKKALKYLHKALEIRKKRLDENNDDTTEIYLNIASAYKSLKDYAQADKYLSKSLYLNQMFDNKNFDLTYSKVQNDLGLLYMLEKDYEGAFPYFKRALQSQEKILDNKHIEMATTYYNMGTVYNATKRYNSAYNFSKKAFDAFLSNRDKVFQIQSKEQKELYLEENKNKIKLLLSTAYQYLDSNRTQAKTVEQDVLTRWLDYKGSVFDSENMIATLHENTQDEILRKQITKLLENKRYLANLYQSLPKPNEKEVWKQDIKKTEEKISTLTNEIFSKVTSFKEQQGLKSISFKDISKELKENELYIDYASVGEKYYVFSLDYKDNIAFKQIDKKSRDEIDRLIKTFREDIALILNENNMSDEKLKQLTDTSKEKLSKLYELVLYRPLEKELKEKINLILSPDGALRLLPFEAMFNKQKSQYLVEQKEIRYIPSGKELVRLYKYSDTTKTNKENSNVVIFSNPNFNEKLTKLASINKEELAITPNTSRTGIIKSLFKMRFNPLPGTKEEAENIKQTLAGKDKIDEYAEEEASEANLVKINKPKILHIATHGFFINDNTIPNPMLKSGIALSGANTSAIKGKSDGIVTALKLSGLDLKGTDLVVLSACQTGVVDVDSTESVSGLSKAFIQAGAKDIVMSLWSVNDQATKDLMSSFYKEMQIQSSYSKALKEAKLKMIKKDMHPFFWAPFIVNGL